MTPLKRIPPCGPLNVAEGLFAVKILEEAALNPRLMADLVQRHKTPEARDAAAKRIYAALFSAGIVDEESPPTD